MRKGPKKELQELSFRGVLDLVLSGDTEAREELFARIASEKSQGALLLAVARRLLPRNDGVRDLLETRDLVQSALRSGWVNFLEFRGTTPAEFLSWIRTILRRKVVRAIRRVKDRRAAQAQYPQRGAASEDSGKLPVGQLIREETRSRVRQAIASLPEGQRVVLNLRLKGLSSPEIASQLGLDPQTVRKRESRALARLRGFLESSGRGDR